MASVGTVALVDGYNMAFRAFYGMPDLTSSTGFPTGAIHGWVRTLWWIEDTLKPDRILVFFDLGGGQRQLAIRPDYKANRTDTPAELEQQIPVIKEWTRAAGYQGHERDGVEADDLLATYACHHAAAGDKVLIVSADKDLAQLVGGSIVQWLPPPTANPRLGWRKLDADGVLEKFGVPPKAVADYLALIGDTSDNIAGLAGVGPKTAAKWLTQYGTLEGVIQHSGELQPKRFQQMVYLQADHLRDNLRMTRLDCDQALLEERGPEPSDGERAVMILSKLGMEKTALKLQERLQARREK